MFKAGQKVKIVNFEQSDISEEDEDYSVTPDVGRVGVVSEIQINRIYPYKICFKNGFCRMYCKEELVSYREPGEQLLFNFMYERKVR